MKVRDIQGGIKVQLSNIEDKLAKHIEENKKIYKDSLTEQDAELAEKMTSKGVLKRKKDDDGTFFMFNGLDDIWRM